MASLSLSSCLPLSLCPPQGPEGNAEAGARQILRQTELIPGAMAAPVVIPPPPTAQFPVNAFTAADVASRELQSKAT